MSTKTAPSLVSHACPTYFKAWCHEAAQPGSSGYTMVGRGFAKKLAEFAPITARIEEWQGELVKLAALRSDDAILQWFDVHLPDCMKQIPSVRRGAFLLGYYCAIREDGIDVTQC